jgi:hypothetical protein
MTSPGDTHESRDERPSLDVPSALTSEQRRVVQLCLSTLAVLGSGSLLGVAFSLYLVNHYPLLLVALSPLGRHVVLVAPLADPFALVAVLVGRRMAFYLASFYLGRALGPFGLGWIEARAARFARFVRWMQGLFSRAPHLVVLTMSGPTVSALAGVARMRLGAFVPLAVLSLVVRMMIMLQFASLMRVYIEAILTWVDEYWVPGTLVMVVAVALYRWKRRSPTAIMED